VQQLDGDSGEEQAIEDLHKDDLTSLEAYRDFMPPELQTQLQQYISPCVIDPNLLDGDLGDHSSNS
jgi:hypothetical protein